MTAAESLRSKGYGKGPGPVPAPMGKGGKGKGKSQIASQQSERQQGAEPIFMIKCTAQLMDGRELDIEIESNATGKQLRSAVAEALEISPHRVKLIFEAVVVLNQDVKELGLQQGSALSVVILPPIYHTLGALGVGAPGEVISAKMELHDALQAAGHLRRIESA
eukprot:CAMPEP_0197648624 /NCGR_PEP_ID=MMETSP1338-20131121/27869_1 /TAXON_ID=43686 ORGANISM="Pelagodinium beii, Strain RCC1491" /NCGR_SAMPLE_ID=MMETSP1338 /ASSEMBLY_ACC=CAM_ASM_000754 /LENGTH=163 /DNA_ID=CAMNT_0043222659 /DNA_START=36 /DNA_END=527 /DNA_ORIENTATION=-